MTSAPMLSPEQARAANPSHSAWISANAGSGKTRVLTARVARLLLQGVEPGRILCLTFTRAAAGEMKTRLFSTLGGWAMRDDEGLVDDLNRLLEDGEPLFDTGDSEQLNRARRLFAQALEYPGGLRIQTMHSFGLSLLRRFPMEAGLSPGLRMLDEHRTSELAASAFESAIRQARSDSGASHAAYRTLVTNASSHMLEDLRKTIIEKRTTYRSFAENSTPEKMAATIQRHLGADGRTEADCVADILRRPELKELLVDPLIEAISEKGSPPNRGLVEKIRSGLQRLETGNTLMALAQLRNVYFTQKGGPQRLPVQQAKKLMLEITGGRDCVDEMQNLLNEAEEARCRAAVAASSIAVATFAYGYLQEYQAARRVEAGLDYGEIVEATHALLSRSEMKEWVRYRLDSDIDHVLVDEAQDTSPEQWLSVRRIVEEYFSGPMPASGPRTVFAVGDEKQSIFSFQGADPQVFVDARKWMARAVINEGPNLIEEQLATSYRCALPILKFVDTVFSRESYAAPPKEGQQRKDEDDSWAKTLLGWDTPLRHQAQNPDAPGRVEVWDLLESEEPGEGSSEARLAQQITRRIASWMKEGTLLPATGRPVRPEDILVLVQHRSAFNSELVRQLRLAGVRTGGRDRIALRDSLVVKDMLALIAFALLPEDDHTLAVVLRSPLCEISEEELYELAHDRGPAPLWQRLQKASHYEAVRDFLCDMISAADRMGPLDFLERALVCHEGRRKLLGRLGLDAIEPLDALLEQAVAFEDGRKTSLEEFVTSIQNSTAEIKATEERNVGVRIMTVHGAKGLEAPIVILPDVLYVPQKAASTRAFLAERNNEGLPLPAVPLFVRSKKDDIPLTQELREQAVLRAREEHYRVFYVALTRAREWLIIGDAQKRNKPNGKCWYYRALNAAHQLGRPVEPDTDGARLGEAFPGLLVEQGEPVAAKTEPVPVPEMAEEIPQWALQDVPPDPRPLKLNPSQMTGGIARMAVGSDEVQEDSGQSSTSLDRGNLIHLLLEHLAGMPAGQQRSKLGETLADRFSEKLTAKERTGIAARAERILDAPDIAWLFTPDGLAEVPFSVPLPETTGSLDGRFDRLVFDGTRVLAVDFKSDAEVPDRPESTGESYLIQLGAYRHAMTAIWPERKVATAILWTGGDTPQLMEMPDPLVDEAFARAYEAQAGTTPVLP